MTSRWFTPRMLLIAAPFALGASLAGCATPQDRCGEYVEAMREVSARCGLGQDEFDVVSRRDPDRVGCRYVSSIEEPRLILRCINFLNGDSSASPPREEVSCGDERLVEFPENLPDYCDPGAFGFND